MKIKYFIYSIILLLCFQSCNIDEEIKDESLGENLRKTASDEALLAPSYSSLRNMLGHRVLFATQEYSSDEAMLPKRLADWFDGGVFETLQKHNWSPTHPYITWAWEDITSGIGRAISAIDLLAANSKEAAEARGLLGLYMLYALDNFNQVPYRDITNIDFDVEPEILKGLDAVNKIISVIETAMPNLESSKNSIRFTQDAAKSVLARLYLNKAVYVDRYASNFNFEIADMKKVISYTTEIINSGFHSLESDDYFSMFDIDNENHKEIIFASRNELNSAPLRNGHSLTRNSTNGVSRGLLLTDTTLGGSYLGGSDAGCTLPGFFDKWNQDDSRFFSQRIPLPASGIPQGPYYDSDNKLLFENVAGVKKGGGEVGTTLLPTKRWTVPKEGKPFVNRGFLVGQQFGPYVKDSESDRAYHYVDGGKNVVFSALITKGGEPAIHTREVKYDAGSQTTGVRVIKWQIDISRKNRDDTGVDIPVFRLADMYLMRAEAKYRSGDITGALADVNKIRTTRNPTLSGFSLPSLSSVDDILDERGFEFYWEYHRRTDQIRFGKWEDTWQSKESNDVNKRIFPIPPSVVAFNKGINQNPGYD